MTSFAVETQGLSETLKALESVQDDLSKRHAGELRAAGESASQELAGLMRAAASSSGVPVAPLVARSVRPAASGGKPAVSVGGGMRVGRYGAPAARLLWGSEHGPSGHVNHFAVAPNGAGYWIAPTVKRYKATGAVARYRSAVATIISKAGL